MASRPPTSKSRTGVWGYPCRILGKIKGLLSPYLRPVSRRSLDTLTPGANQSTVIPPIEPNHAVRGEVHSLSRSQLHAQEAPISAPGSSLGVFTSSTSKVSDALGDHSMYNKARIQSDIKAKDNSQCQTSSSLTTLEIALRALRQGARVFPPLQSVVDTLISCLGLVEAATKHRQECSDLASELKSLSELLMKHSHELESSSMSDCVINVVKSLGDEVQHLNREREQRFAIGVVRASANADELPGCIRRIQALLRRLEVDITMSIWSIANEHLANTRLEALIPVKVAGYNSALPDEAGIVRRKCTEGTRTENLSELTSWSDNPEGKKVYWMNGMAGTGKTTIACSFSTALAKRKQLGASFFCTRALPECRDARRIVPTVAYQLARYSRPFQSALCKILEREPDIAMESIETQFERLLREPLLTVKNAMPNNVVVVIDALDECSDINGIRTFLNELFRSPQDLAIKFLITSRPERGIREKISCQSNDALAILHLHEIVLSLVQADIELYLKEELASISASNAQIKRLAQLAGNLFIYAATAVRYILPPNCNTPINPQERLQVVLSIKHESIKQYAELDALYKTILTGVFNETSLEANELERGKHVLWTAACAREPITIETLAALSGFRNEDTLVILQSLRSVLHISESSNLISPFHASFPEFIFAQERSHEFFCDENGYASLLAQKCFGTMKSELRFNICGLESSFALDDSVDDLEARVNRHVSRLLNYACRYWADHLSAAAPSEDLCRMLDDFLSTRLLFWMEVLNLTKSNTRGIRMLQKIQQWLLTSGTPTHQVRLVSEARTFVTAFSANPVSLSTPHIYVSALPFFYRSIPLLVEYWKRMQGLLSAEGTAVEQMGAAPLANWNIGHAINSIALSADGSLIAFGGGNKEGAMANGSGQIGVLNWCTGKCVVGPFKAHSDSVRAVAFSIDSTRIVSAASDKTICIWNAEDGTLLAGPLEGHTKLVRSVAFSPDGTRIVSGSDDSTLRLWNAQDGKLVAGPIKGHANSVFSVSFSRDGTRVASGSLDRTICVWNPEDGKLVTGPFKGHTSSVCSVSFSPDGMRIVSGSWDKTVCVWDAHDGTLAAGPFKGHTNFVRSVAFSPDGTRVVSGSEDKSIIVWDAQDGKLVAGPFKGHSSGITSVAFSIDGMRIVSASSDKTICVWNAQDSGSATGFFRGHTHRIRSVAFSPDGRYIASGSEDNTICLWHTQDGKLATDPLRGHTEHVGSVSFSPDGTRIVSGSSDKTIRVWRVPDGNLVTDPLRGHTGWVRSVVFSPDGSRIASGSDDKTICVWNAQNGGLVAGPFQGHTDVVRSVAFSPDGVHIVSGSDDSTICVWNAEDGSPVIGPFGGHLDLVMSVAFSPDGTRIVSGSADETICIWSAQDGKPLAGPFKGHSNYVRSVAFSADGPYIVSGSGDMTTCVWDSRDGRLVAGPFKGHTGLVNSVAFSPDDERPQFSHRSLIQTSKNTEVVAA